MNIVYNASAGTGKTYQVTGLYEKLVLEEDIDPRKILLMTFTENAAAELRMRVAHRFQKARRTAELDDDFDTAERAITALNHLPSAPIGTIHSFCTKLLREHALDAGLSPAFSVLQGDEHKELLNRICREELLQKLETDPDFRDFCSGMHIIGTGGFGSSITESIPKLFEAADSAGITLDHAVNLLPSPQPLPSLADFSSILERMKELPKLTAKAQPVFQALETLIPTVGNPEELIEQLCGLSLGKFGAGKGQKPISDDFFELLENGINTLGYTRRFPAAKAYAEYAQTVYRKFKQAKHEMDAVDFADQLHMAATLLKSGKAKPEFRYVIVDEVQDTSRIQCELIQSLWNEETYLVICGDKKQSIYTWRGADPQVMPDLEKAILSRKNHALENLQISYRSKAPIIDCVNALFSTVYASEDYAEGDQLKTNDAFKTAGEKPCVEFLHYDGDDEAPRSDKTAQEMEAVAHRIQLLVSGSNDWKPNFRYSDGFQPSENHNTYRYSDILILLRRTTNQSALEQALQHAGIPYTLGGKGRGLFSRQETKDVSLFLTAITNPDDALSLIGFLRSPWIGLSDEQIARLAWNKDGFSIDELKASYDEETDVIDRYAALTGTHLTSELVRMLIEETGYDALLAGLPRGEQRLANLRKILDWLRETERGARTTPAMVARKLAEMIAEPPQVPEAALLDPAQNAVTIMTVHGSKGLTKRVVMIPDCSFSDNGDKGFIRIHENALELRLTNPDKTKAESPGFAKASAAAKAVRQHEDKNLFYVAMTRARDLVITSATVGRSPAGWLKYLDPMIGNQIPAIAYTELAEAVGRTPISPGNIPTEAELQAALDQLPAAPEKPNLERIPATRYAKERDELENDEIYSPSPPFPLSPLTGKDAAALGSLGHAVLEHLALNTWQGDVSEWLEKLKNDFGVSKTDAADLAERIEEVRRQMISATEGMKRLRPELPFVLHHDGKLIDGTIDLLCETHTGYAVFDYKFTNAPDEHIKDTYRGQMKLYALAADRFYPEATGTSIHLVVVSGTGTRLIPLEI
ncbi:UvrD-helicase domain-containing protein [Pontiella agarivorans]|uniref:DNA 3'-5' helicase n=1 Tax=Pontiella agarivorans TaxID=3038953 RepID=A0ABU5MZF3_9BACT|nr:UvrD-helicase domain-containing protein [Pontiella agarivorans]MDZ8119588.1 UvrD-helicase domain-containing protein [Pontiella agarivorans]